MTRVAVIAALLALGTLGPAHPQGNSVPGGYPSTIYAKLPPAATNPNAVMNVTDVGTPGGVWWSNGTRWLPYSRVTLARSAVRQCHTGDLTEFKFNGQAVVPSNAMGTDGRLEIRSTWTFTLSKNDKIMRVRFGGMTGPVVVTADPILATNTFWHQEDVVQNRGATNSQILGTPGGSGATTVQVSSFAVGSLDTTVAQTVVFSGQLGVATEQVCLEQFEVMLLP
jgi:hypothetical protein